MQFNFPSIENKARPQLQCVVCGEMLTSESLKLSPSSYNLETKHENYIYLKMDTS